MTLFALIVCASQVSAEITPVAASGLTLTRFDNSATAGKGDSTVVSSLESIADCDGAGCGKPSSLRLTGQLKPPAAGNYGFNVTFDPPLPYPSSEGYARLWVHDHLLYPISSGEAMKKPKAGDRVPLWVPLPPRALDVTRGRVPVPVEHAGAAPLGSYEFRFEYV